MEIQEIEMSKGTRWIVLGNDYEVVEPIDEDAET